MKNPPANSPASGGLTAADLVKNCGIPADRADAVLEVMTARSVSPTRALELVESAAWHRAVEDGRAEQMSEAGSQKPAEPTAS